MKKEMIGLFTYNGIRDNWMTPTFVIDDEKEELKVGDYIMFEISETGNKFSGKIIWLLRNSKRFRYTETVCWRQIKLSVRKGCGKCAVLVRM